MGNPKTPAVDLLTRLVPLSTKERVKIFKGLLPEGLDYAQAALEVLGNISKQNEEITIKAEDIRFQYRFYDGVDVTAEGISFVPEHYPNQDKVLIASFRHRFTLMGLEILLDEHDRKSAPVGE